MEHLWSRAGATGGNRSQMGQPRKRLKHGKPLLWVATSCRSGRIVKSAFASACHRLRRSPLCERGGRCVPDEVALPLAAAVRARTLVASATCASRTDHAPDDIGARGAALMRAREQSSLLDGSDEGGAAAVAQALAGAT